MIDPIRERAVAHLPRPDVATSELVLFSLGAGALASVAISIVEQVLRLVLRERPVPVSGEAVAVAVGVLAFCLVRGLDRGALWIPITHAVALAATFFIALLVYVYLGRRATGDPLANLVPAFTAVAVATALGAALGTVARTAVPIGTAAHAPILVRAVGVAVIAGAVVHVVWPSSFFIAVAGAGRIDDVRTVVLSLPDLFAGAIAGGIYAARRDAGYVGLVLVGAFLILPSVIAQAIVAPSQIANDPSLRRAYAVVVLLDGLRIAAWPLAAAFVHGFMSPPSEPPDET